MGPCRALLSGIVIAGSGMPILAAQLPDSTPQVQTIQAPGVRYRAGALHRFLLGREYRDLWTTPVSVPVLDLRTFAGGLTPISRGGGQQTRSLLFRAPDGREFFFRSVDKDPTGTLPPELRRTVAGQVVRDQTSSAFPTAPLVVGPLLKAAGIFHGKSFFFTLPADSGLGEFQEEFGGLMGFLQERIGGGSGPAWRGAAEIIGTDTLLARITRAPNDRADARAFLTARLFDVLIGDWDRHTGQWRWVRFGNAVPHRWVPIPEDRDQAFVKYDGALLSVARQTAPQLTNFGPDYPYLPGATWNGRELDRRILVELDWPRWESVTVGLQAALTDQVIENAVRALPPEHYALAGARLTAYLRARRDKLLAAARGYYELLGREVDVHGADGSDLAALVRRTDGSLDVTISREEAGSADTYFRRHFDPQTTREVRLFLGLGNDRAEIQGQSSGPSVRIIGGGGDDQLIDSSRAGKEHFYDDPAGAERTAGLASKVDRRPYNAPIKDSSAVPPRDWGSRWTASTWATLGPDMGLLIGGGRTLTAYGFRKDPYAVRHRFRAGFATGPKTYRLDYRGEFRGESSARHLDILVRASGIDVISFSGFGNEIAAPGNNEFYRVTQDAFSIQPSLVLPVGSRGSFRAGPILKYASTDRRPERFLGQLPNVYGAGSFGELGAGAALQFDSRNRVHGATRGMSLELGGRIYPALWHVDSTFGKLHGEITTYLTPRVPFEPTLALRLGGRKLWGSYPFFEAAFIGGASTVRLGRVNRYAGDAAAYGNAELRLALATVTLVLPADVGIFGLADAGRVFLEGESSDKWHTAFGGGLWLSYLNRAHTISAAVAAGEERTGLYVQAGFGF